MKGRLSALLIASAPNVMEMLARAIRNRLKELELRTATNEMEALQTLRSEHFDIVICDLYLNYTERISFISDVCTLIAAERELIVITAATDVTKRSFPSSIRGQCIRNVIHKPIDLEHLLAEIEKAVLEVKSRQEEPE